VLRLQHVLDQWQRWCPAPAQRPTPQETLSEGLSNHSVRVSDGRDQWVVRLDGLPPEPLGLNRALEYSALQKAAAHALAPAPVFQCADTGALVCAYLPPDEDQQHTPQQLAQLLQRIHALPPLPAQLNVLARAQRYLELAGGDVLPEPLRRAHARLGQLPVQNTLCHNDLLAANRLVSGGRLRALDWEYAAMGDPWFDLAVIVEGDAWTDAATNTLLQSWLSRPPREEDVERLALQRTVYRELAALWEGARIVLLAKATN
jgi:thiamine kinase-like enzyme